MKHALVTLFALATLGGCAHQPMPDSFGFAEQIEYRTEGEPIDVAEALPDSLTLADALAEAIRHDPELQSALARLHVAMAEARQSRLLPNPVLSVVVRFPEGGGSPTIEAGLTAELLALLGRPGRISAADHRLRAAGADVLMVALDLIAQTQERFIAVQSIEAELAGLERQLELVNRLASIARARVEAGEASRLDALSLDAQRIRVDSEILDAGARLRDQRLALVRLLGRPSDESGFVIAPWIPAADDRLDERATIDSALANRPEVQVRRWELAALGDERALTSWWLLDGGEAGIDAERDDGNWSIGPSVAVPLPLFDWGQARKQKATAAVVEARHELVKSQRQVVEEVRRALAAVRLSREALVKVRDELVPVLERRHEQGSAAYEIGEADVTSVLLAEQELQEARSRRVELEQRVAMSQVKLDRAVGAPIELLEQKREP